MSGVEGATLQLRTTRAENPFFTAFVAKIS
ncbi:hypothetical protein T479_08050 [Lysinibacillus varians]|nr:hypothetical protein T479_08050 [Lysinibacillus varians]